MLASLLPFVLLPIGIVIADYRAARVAATQTVQEVARGTALAADNLGAFRVEADTLAKRQFAGASIALLDVTGQQFFNTFKPNRASLPEFISLPPGV